MMHHWVLIIEVGFHIRMDAPPWELKIKSDGDPVPLGTAAVNVSVSRFQSPKSHTTVIDHVVSLLISSYSCQSIHT